LQAAKAASILGNMSRRPLDATRWAFAALSLGCILAIWLFNPRSGPALALLFLFMLFGTPAVMLSVSRPLPARFRKKKR
jgi:hypothetical protein